ncbi:hypothetical protein LAZ67_2005147 [Cordylochernes scorpioides]|uniref:Uncharacterized protein n=1 Tax=Cordylochernes scorpioides TaxID=51811 RepID=A0ABY6K450_9ARAC|nr:hypothetical protein LAZ67_2005147 [Cordylochernes scorpioides]
MDVLFWIDVCHIEGCKDGRVYMVQIPPANRRQLNKPTISSVSHVLSRITNVENVGKKNLSRSKPQPSEAEKALEQAQVEAEIKQLPERKRRTLLRYMASGKDVSGPLTDMNKLSRALDSDDEGDSYDEEENIGSESEEQ